VTATRSLRGDTPSRRGIHALIVDKIGRSIVAGTFPPGTVIPSEGEYSASLAVSRTSVREAIKMLAGKGLVESRPKIGTRVRARRAWNMLDPDVTAWAFEALTDSSYARAFFEFRGMIEPEAAALAADRRSAEDLDRLREGLDGMRAAAGRDDWVAPDLLFHQAILAATGNELLISLGHLLEPAFAYSFGLTTLDAERRSATVAQHKAIYRAIEKRDPQAAREAMTSLLERAGHRVEEVYGPEPAAETA